MRHLTIQQIALIAEHIHGTDFGAIRSQQARFLGTVYAYDAEKGPSLVIGRDEDGNLFIARPGSGGRVPDDTTTAHFQEVAAQLFPALAMVEAA